jgi:hypothetical protein
MTPEEAAAERITKLVKISKFNGYSVAGVAGGFALLSLTGLSLSGVIIGGALTGCGVMEIKGHRRLAAGEPGARGLMVGSQVLLVVFILAYCAWRLASFDAANPLAIVGSLESQVRQLAELAMVPLSELEAQVRLIYTWTYRLVAGVTLVMQGGLATYYWVRVGQVEESR